MTTPPINELTSKTIHTGTVIGVVILVVGLLLSGTDFGQKVLLAGVIVLVMTPFAGILTSMTCLFKSGDRVWGTVAVVLVIVVAVGLVLTLMT